MFISNWFWIIIYNQNHKFRLPYSLESQQEELNCQGVFAGLFHSSWLGCKLRVLLSRHVHTLADEKKTCLLCKIYKSFLKHLFLYIVVNKFKTERINWFITPTPKKNPFLPIEIDTKGKTGRQNVLFIHFYAP